MSKNLKLFIFDKENNVIHNEKILVADEHGIETKHSVFENKDCDKYFNETDGNVYYVVNADLPAKVEANNLKNLRRSNALNNIFNYDVNKTFDVISLLPWLVIILLVLFK